MAIGAIQSGFSLNYLRNLTAKTGAEDEAGASKALKNAAGPAEEGAAGQPWITSGDLANQGPTDVKKFSVSASLGKPDTVTLSKPAGEGETEAADNTMWITSGRLAYSGPTDVSSFSVAIDIDELFLDPYSELSESMKAQRAAQAAKAEVEDDLRKTSIDTLVTDKAPSALDDLQDNLDEEGQAAQAAQGAESAAAGGEAASAAGASAAASSTSSSSGDGEKSAEAAQAKSIDVIV